MRVLCDCRYTRTDFHDGISRYSAELGAAVHRDAPGHGVEVTFLIFDDAQRRFLPDDAEVLNTATLLFVVLRPVDSEAMPEVAEQTALF